MLQAADECRRAEHQQHVADDRAGQGGLDEIGQAFAQRQRADDQFGGVAERRVEQAADAAAEPFGEHARRAADQCGQRQDGEQRCAEDRRVVLGHRQLEPDRNRDEAEQQELPVTPQEGHRLVHPATDRAAGTHLSGVAVLAFSG